MFKFQKPKIDLISIHIPKTAGTSFRNILKGVYGEKAVARVDIPLAVEAASHERRAAPSLGRGIRVLHGHFRYHDLAEHYRLDHDIPVITWLRDPVERVISNYFYLQKILRDILREEKRNTAILNKMEKSLLEYARAEIARNRMSKFLDGKQLRDFLFVGIVEYFPQDLTRLSALLGWKKARALEQNSSREQKTSVSDEVRAEILKLNERDADLYKEALRLRDAAGGHPQTATAAVPSAAGV
jgi:hypothetical protein